MTSQIPRPTLIIVRHARPEVDPEHPAASLPLAEEGRHAALALGERLHMLGPLQIIASDEVKAIQTGDAIAPGQSIASDERFGEQGRGSVPFLAAEAFRECAIAHFREPNAVILGEESSREAANRLNTAIGDLMSTQRDDAIPAIVSHGRIISAWLTEHARPEHGERPAADRLWASLQMPDAFLLWHDPTPGDRDWIWRRLDHEGAH